MTCEPGRASYTIRPANPADLPALQALAAACDVCRPGGHDPLWLAENAHGTPLGFIACTQVLDEMSLLSLAVHPAKASPAPCITRRSPHYVRRSPSSKCAPATTPHKYSMPTSATA